MKIIFRSIDTRYVYGKYISEINYFDHFYFIRVYLNLFHAALLASGTHPIHYVVYFSRKITKSDLDVDNVCVIQYFTFIIVKCFRTMKYLIRSAKGLINVLAMIEMHTDTDQNLFIE